jgi:ABC-type branched-subunit amino acid transport system ATPase component
MIAYLIEAILDALVGFCGPRRTRVNRRDHLRRLAIRSESSSSRAVRNSATARVCRSSCDQSERLDHAGNQLSGGEQHMLAIGRALMTNPILMILDEAHRGIGAVDP